MSNLINGNVTAGESCFHSERCDTKVEVNDGAGCPVADGRTHTVPFSCALARLADLMQDVEEREKTE